MLWKSYHYGLWHSHASAPQTGFTLDWQKHKKQRGCCAGFWREGVARTVRAPCKVPIRAFSWALFFPRFQAQRTPSQRASKTSALAWERQQEKCQAAKSVKIDISDEDLQEVVDWLLRHRQETSGKNQYMSAVVFSQKMGTKLPVQGRKKHQVSSKGLWRPSTSIWEHPPEWCQKGAAPCEHHATTPSEERMIC